MIQIEKKVFNFFSANTYIVWDDKTYETMVIDPGCSNKEEEKELGDFINTHNLKIKFIVNTHCHIDHVFGNSFLKKNYGGIILLPKDDEFLFELMIKQAEKYGLVFHEPIPKPDEYLSEDKELILGATIFKPLFTPGHSPGEFCILCERESICFTGDVLFKEGIGRTDLWGGDYATLVNSIQTKLFTLPDDIEIYPGHGDVSTIGWEKIYNPFLP